ncbi:LacI family DNA-binding transcriptional regulator [Caballeronia sp. 15711]|uniref:LacI family DNA-binding transcriptional regulator n=1 Tax=Caballeronia sp. 15711 TaxID=3391029 RepID=UPI0039E6AC57
MVTIKDIARVVGFSPSTVARALNHDPRITADTTARVKSVAKELGYVAHLGARLMAGGRSNLIGLIVPDVENQFYATLAQAMSECSEEGFQLLLSVTDDDPEKEHQHLRALVEARASGVVVVPTHRPTKESVELLERLACVQLIRNVPALKTDWFAFDDQRGVYEATRHLIELGHRRIAYVGSTDKLSTGASRLKGYQLALSEAGIERDPSLIVTLTPRAEQTRDAFVELYRQQSPTAVVAGGSSITVGLLDCIHTLKLSVPQELSIVGFGDPPWFEWWGPGMTTIHLPVREIALTSAACLIRRIRDKATDSSAVTYKAQHVVHQPLLLIRGSTGEPARKASHKLPAAGRRREKV